MTPWDAELVGVVTLPDGRQLRGRGLSDGAPTGNAVPEFGLYLTATPPTEIPWESGWVNWPDFGLPRSAEDALEAIRDAYERSVHMRVEIACDGGQGRTGTALAILARFAGVPAAEVVAWVRANYRPNAIETPQQRRFARSAKLAS